MLVVTLNVAVSMVCPHIGYMQPPFTILPGNLALSRALGDFDFKKNTFVTPEEQVITSNPDVSVREIDEDDEFLVMACDGE